MTIPQDGFSVKFSSIIRGIKAGDNFSGVEELLEEIATRKKILERQRLKILYPKQSSDNDNLRSVGLAEENNALLFLNSGQSSRQIKDKLINSLDLNKIEFASTIFEKILPQIPKDEKELGLLKYKSPEKYFLLSSIKALYERFSKEWGLDKIEGELNQLYKMENEIYEAKKKLEGFGRNNIPILNPLVHLEFINT